MSLGHFCPIPLSAYTLSCWVSLCRRVTYYEHLYVIFFLGIFSQTLCMYSHLFDCPFVSQRNKIDGTLKMLPEIVRGFLREHAAEIGDNLSFRDRAVAKRFYTFVVFHVFLWQWTPICCPFKIDDLYKNTTSATSKTSLLEKLKNAANRWWITRGLFLKHAHVHFYIWQIWHAFGHGSMIEIIPLKTTW